MRYYLICLFLLLSGCSGYEEVFSPTYHDSACVPTQGMTYIESLQAATSGTDSTNSEACCGQKGGVVSCCVGGYYACVDGSGGRGCGCPAL